MLFMLTYSSRLLVAFCTQGCGIVEYHEAPAALAAMQALHTKYHWTGGDTTMVVEWMDPARHRKDKQAQEEGEDGLAAPLGAPCCFFLRRSGCCCSSQAFSKHFPVFIA
jgi:hypothetical protein